MLVGLHVPVSHPGEHSKRQSPVAGLLCSPRSPGFPTVSALPCRPGTGKGIGQALPSCPCSLSLALCPLSPQHPPSCWGTHSSSTDLRDRGSSSLDPSPQPAQGDLSPRA